MEVGTVDVCLEINDKEVDSGGSEDSDTEYIWAGRLVIWAGPSQYRQWQLSDCAWLVINIEANIIICIEWSRTLFIPNNAKIYTLL